MGLAYIRTMQPVGEYQLMEIVEIGSGSAPPRPTPGPTPPGGPVDPGYSPPWAQIPVDPGYGIPEFPGYPGNPPRPTHPIMLPGMPGWGVPPVGGGGPGTPTPGPGGGVSAVVIPMPPTEPPTAPPAGMPAGSTQHLVWFGPGTKPAMAWVGPYASTGPITPPAAPAPEAAKK